MSLFTSSFDSPTIHRIDLESIQLYKRCQKPLTNHTILTILRSMVDIYNSRLKDKPAFYRFKEVTFGGEFNREASCHFRIFCVWRKIIRPSSSFTQFVENLGGRVDFSSSSTEVILFFYRFQNSDVFALAEGTAWRLFSQHRDAFFARALAEQMITPPISHIKTRPLVGDKTHSDNKHDRLRCIQEAKLGFTVIEGLTARTKKEAFPEELSHLRKNLPNLTLQEKALTLHCSLTAGECFRFFDHLSSLYCRAEDLSIDSSRSSDSSANSLPIAFLTNLQPADKSLLDQMQEALCREVWRIFKDDRILDTPLRFIAQKSSEYRQAAQYSFSKLGKGRTRNCWQHYLPTSELIKKLAACKMRDLFHSIQSRPEQAERFYKEFRNRITGIKIYFKKSKKVYSENFLHRLEGEIILGSGEHYFHVKEEWIRPRLDFFAALHREFIELLDISLIDSNDIGHLPKPWLGRQEKEGVREDVEGKYNLSYADEENYIVGDKACPHFIEIFDIMFHDPDHKTLYFYQVKEKFGGGTRAAACQLMNAADAISAIIQGDKSWLREFSKDLKGNNPKAYEGFVKWGDVKKLEELIKTTPKTDIVFVYALAEISSNNRSLKDELSLIHTFEKKDFEEMAKGLTCSAEELEKILKEEEIVDTLCQLSALGLTCLERRGKEYFLEALEKRLKREEIELLHEHFKRKSATKFQSSIPRFSMLKAARHIRNRGFEFKIDQINSANASLPSNAPSVLFLNKLPEVHSTSWIPEQTVTLKGKSYTLHPTFHGKLAPLHAIMGRWSGEERAFVWELDEPKARQKFVKQIEAKLQQERGQDEKPMREELKRSFEKMLIYKMVSNAPKFLSVRNFWNIYSYSEEVKLKIDQYLKDRHKYEKEFPSYTKNVDQEISPLKRVISCMNSSFHGKASIYPNKVIKSISGETVDQKKRNQRVDRYNKHPETLEKDYKSNRSSFAKCILEKKTPQAVAESILKKKRLSEDTEAIQKLFNSYRAERAYSNLQKQLEELNPANLYLESLSWERSYGLEEAKLAALVAPHSVSIYQEDPESEKTLKPVLDTSKGDEPERIVFMSCYKKRALFFVLEEETSTVNDEDSTLDDTTVGETLSKKTLPSWMRWKNIGNSCYLDAAVQALLASSKICEYIQIGTKNALQKAIEGVIAGKESQENLKGAIFASSHPEFTEGSFDKQLDAAAVIELFSQFTSPLPIETYRTVEGYDVVFKAPADPTPMLQLSLDESTSLEEALGSYLGEQESTNDWRCDPSASQNSGMEGKDYEEFKKKPPFQVASHKTVTFLKKMPTTLLLHLKRFKKSESSDDLSKLHDKITLPEEGTIYLTSHGALSLNDYTLHGGLKAKYCIKSYVVHKGELNGGHYISYLEWEGGYYRCNDLKEVREISREKFLNRTDLYLAVLEKQS